MFLGMCPWCVPRSPGWLLVERQAGQIPFGAARARGAFEPACGFPGVGVEQHRQPGNGALIKLPFAAHIADPGGEPRNHDQLLPQPGEIGDVPKVHHASRAFTAWE